MTVSPPLVSVVVLLPVSHWICVRPSWLRRSRLVDLKWQVEANQPMVPSTPVRKAGQETRVAGCQVILPWVQKGEVLGSATRREPAKIADPERMLQRVMARAGVCSSAVE